MFTAIPADEYVATGVLVPVTEGGWLINGDPEEASASAPPSPTSIVSNLTRAPKRLEDYVGYRFSAHRFVDALLAARSGDVLHVWVVTSEWTATARKELYAEEKKLIAQFPDETFDFYLLKAQEGLTPGDLVTGLPVIWERER